MIYTRAVKWTSSSSDKTGQVSQGRVPTAQGKRGSLPKHENKYLFIGKPQGN